MSLLTWGFEDSDDADLIGMGLNEGYYAVVTDEEETRVYDFTKAGGGAGSTKKHKIEKRVEDFIKDVIETERIYVERKNSVIDIEIYKIEDYKIEVSLKNIKQETPIKIIKVDFKDR
jgi:hypothetical protein